MKWKRMVLIAVTCLSVGLVSACGTNKPAPEGKSTEKPHEPVILTLFSWGKISDDIFQQRYVEPVKQKYPYITLRQIFRTGPGVGEPADYIAQGEQIDLVVGVNSNPFKELDLLYDITPDVKKANIDLNRFTQESLERTMSDGKLYGFPLSVSNFVLTYNKDIFDKFGVPYPRDGMTWDEFVPMIQKLTQMDNGVQYRGFHPQNVLAFMANSPFPSLYVDPKTNKVNITSESYKEVLELYKRIATIPGNMPPNALQGEAYSGLLKGFLNEKTIAVVMADFSKPASDAGLNWDFAQPPSFKNYPNVAGSGEVVAISPTKSSKYKDEAMAVISVLTSDEVRLQAAKSLSISPLKDQKFKDAFGTDAPYLKGKNIQAIFKSKPKKYVESSPVVDSNDVSKIFYAIMVDYLSGKVDVNTALRTAEEQIQAKVNEKYGK